MTVFDELDDAGVADTLDDEEDVDAGDDELAVELPLPLLAVDGLVEWAEALVIGLAAIQPAAPVNATPDSTAVTRRARAAG